MAGDSKSAVTDLAALGCAFAIDRAWGEPPDPWHPVVWMGRLVTLMEHCRPRQSPIREWLWGAATVTVVVGSAAAGGWAMEQATRGLPLVLAGPMRGLVLKTLFAGRALEQAAGHVAQALAQDDMAQDHIAQARAALGWLVSRERSDLTREEVASAAIESVAENTSDSLMAPLLAYGLFGLPGAAAYRAVNTLDAMLGYHGEYEYAGKAAARLDDMVNLLPARITAVLLCLASPAREQAARIARRDHGLTESPNAGWPMAAMAGALDVCLPKRGAYRLHKEAPLPQAAQVFAAIKLMQRATVGAFVVSLLCLMGRALWGAFHDA